eukprot:CAMPEP_0179280840 /NCGR_PEP_ID=MMETSP0797-20121207/36836_1 /TAXON_ID=47934 /ORGANISM="Dinophysis acuminata, Strain DAEP01" /LENGTH=162 /DNA_ID=CAMNT_0020989511 /DNA_START=184 /DNA_END=674 /DNA_ORIENTATION=+
MRSILALCFTNSSGDSLLRSVLWNRNPSPQALVPFRQRLLVAAGLLVAAAPVTQAGQKTQSPLQQRPVLLAQLLGDACGVRIRAQSLQADAAVEKFTRADLQVLEDDGRRIIIEPNTLGAHVPDARLPGRAVHGRSRASTGGAAGIAAVVGAGWHCGYNGSD